MNACHLSSAYDNKNKKIMCWVDYYNVKSMNSSSWRNKLCGLIIEALVQYVDTTDSGAKSGSALMVG